MTRVCFSQARRADAASSCPHRSVAQVFHCRQMLTMHDSDDGPTGRQGPQDALVVRDGRGHGAGLAVIRPEPARLADRSNAVFANDLEGKPNASNPRIMGARNYASVRYVDESGELEFDLRMELKRGGGKTKGYVSMSSSPMGEALMSTVQTVCAPPPNYV